jgi:predicted acetylornithine/succinylornithine family transaminase
MTQQEIFENYNRYILGTYRRQPLVFVKGKGSMLIDIHGKKYLDFFSSGGVNNVGHCHPKVMAAVRDQIGRLIHIPHNFYHPQQPKLAKEIIRNSFPGKVFFCNSGAEAVEAAIKFARAYGKGERGEIIAMQNPLPGPAREALTATGQKKYPEGCGPLLEGFKTIPLNSLETLNKTINDKTVALLLELIQGEGGINVAQKEYVQALRRMCDEKNILLIVDEVQTGMGRTGEMFSYQHYAMIPDCICLAKALGGGLPIGALVVKETLVDTFKPGMLASTFSGGPLVCKAALGVFKAIHAEKMLKNTKIMGEFFLKRLKELQQKFDCIREVCGLGLMLSVELHVDGKPIKEECLQQGLIINCAHKKVLRLRPALNVTQKQIEKALYILEKAFAAQRP